MGIILVPILVTKTATLLLDHTLGDLDLNDSATATLNDHITHARLVNLLTVAILYNDTATMINPVTFVNLVVPRVTH